MAKLTLDQKIAKVIGQIAKEEKLIDESKEKIKKLNVELKSLQLEKEHSFANDIIKLMKEKGLSQEELLAQLTAQTVTKSSETISSPNDNSSNKYGSTY